MSAPVHRFVSPLGQLFFPGSLLVVLLCSIEYFLSRSRSRRVAGLVWGFYTYITRWMNHIVFFLST